MSFKGVSCWNRVKYRAENVYASTIQAEIHISHTDVKIPSPNSFLCDDQTTLKFDILVYVVLYFNKIELNWFRFFFFRSIKREVKLKYRPHGPINNGWFEKSCGQCNRPGKPVSHIVFFNMFDSYKNPFMRESWVTFNPSPLPHHEEELLCCIQIVLFSN